MSTSNDSFEIIKQLYDIIMSYEDKHPGTIDRIESSKDLDESDSQLAIQAADDELLQESAQANLNDEADDEADDDSSDNWIKAFGNVRQFTKPLQIDEN